MASWLVRSSPGQAVCTCVQAMAGDIVLCSWAKHLTLTEPPSTQVPRVRFFLVFLNLILIVSLNTFLI